MSLVMKGWSVIKIASTFVCDLFVGINIILWVWGRIHPLLAEDHIENDRSQSAAGR